MKGVIGYSVFEGCSGLTSITIGKGMKVLSEGFLSSAYYCKTVYLPSTLTQVWCLALPENATTIYCFAVDVPVLYPNNNMPQSCKIYVPKGYVDKYKTVNGWKDHAANIFEMPKGITEP